MEFKGTKGKWKHYKNHDNSDSYTVSTINGFGLFVSAFNSNTFERQANALLISKAPEMLEMLIKLKDTLAEGKGIVYDDYVKLDNLIKQATEI